MRRPSEPEAQARETWSRVALWLATCIAVFGTLPSIALADTPRDLIQQGNEHYATGRYQEALDSYELAVSADETMTSPALLHNQAAANFKLDQIDEAREIWSRVKSLGDASFEARTSYNLGNCDYAQALNVAAGLRTGRDEMDPQQALERLDEASELYRDALRLDPTLTDARANLELTHLLKKQLEQQLQQQQQQQGQQGEQEKQDQDKQPASQPSESQDNQQSEQSEQGDSSQNQPDEEGEEEEQEEKQQAQAESQPTPAESQPTGSEQEADQPATPIHLTPAQAERLLQMVRDAEKARREMLARQRAARHKPVERDW
ncbi:MAG: hypothetical protein KAY37_00115 [Phycisphaerae bacterium]|nr:hypothetical protein [Phycisphaerae bacterium]